MINAFRALNPLNILWLGIILLVLRISFVIQMPDHVEFLFAEPFARLLIPAPSEYFFSPINNLLVASLLVFVQGLWLNQIINKYNLLGKPTFLPALMYITLTALFAKFLILSPPLICNLLAVWMIDKLFSLYNNDGAISSAYDLGAIVGLATLIYFPFIYLSLVVWIALVIFRAFNWREWLAVLIGFATIFFFLAVYYYWKDRINDFYKIWLPLASSFPNQVKFNYYNYIIVIPIIVIMVLATLRLRQNFFKSYVQMRKSYQLLFFFFIIATLSFYVKVNFLLNHFLLCAVPCAVIFSYYFLYATRRWFYESLYILLVLGIIYFQFNTF
jgi:hypothetical protein